VPPDVHLKATVSTVSLDRMLPTDMVSVGGRVA
jgi:hypothetical protein